MTWWLCCLVVTLAFDSSPIKGEGVLMVGLSCFVRVTRLPSGLRIKSAMTVPCCFVLFHPYL